MAKKQMVEIAKALTFDAKILILDEPTASLTQREVDALFSVIRKLKARGIAIAYISHRLEEIFLICDRVTVIRDGKYISTNEVSQTNKDRLVADMKTLLASSDYSWMKLADNAIYYPGPAEDKNQEIAATLVGSMRMELTGYDGDKSVAYASRMLQADITIQVPVLVVDAFEIVDIQENHHLRLFQHVLVRSPIVRLGQWVVGVLDADDEQISEEHGRKRLRSFFLQPHQEFPTHDPDL